GRPQVAPSQAQIVRPAVIDVRRQSVPEKLVPERIEPAVIAVGPHHRTAPAQVVELQTPFDVLRTLHAEKLKRIPARSDLCPENPVLAEVESLQRNIRIFRGRAGI